MAYLVKYKVNMIPELSEKQLDKLSDFCVNLGIVFIASVITPLFTGVDTLGSIGVVWGVGMMLISLTISVVLVKERKT